MQEYGLDFRFLLDELLVQHPKIKIQPSFSFHAETVTRQPTEPHVTPRIREPPTQPSSRSTTPAPRSRTPQPPALNVPPPTPQLASPQPRRAGTLPPPESPRLRRADTQNLNDFARPPDTPNLRRADTQTPTSTDFARPPRSARSSPAPPPRSTNRPGSSVQRPPPVAVPRREGMI